MSVMYRAFRLRPVVTISTLGGYRATAAASVHHVVRGAFPSVSDLIADLARLAAGRTTWLIARRSSMAAPLLSGGLMQKDVAVAGRLALQRCWARVVQVRRSLVGH